MSKNNLTEMRQMLEEIIGTFDYYKVGTCLNEAIRLADGIIPVVEVPKAAYIMAAEFCWDMASKSNWMTDSKNMSDYFQYYHRAGVYGEAVLNRMIEKGRPDVAAYYSRSGYSKVEKRCYLLMLQACHEQSDEDMANKVVEWYYLPRSALRSQTIQEIVRGWPKMVIPPDTGKDSLQFPS